MVCNKRSHNLWFLLGFALCSIHKGVVAGDMEWSIKQDYEEIMNSLQNAHKSIMKSGRIDNYTVGFIEQARSAIDIFKDNHKDSCEDSLNDPQAILSIMDFATPSGHIIFTQKLENVSCAQAFFLSGAQNLAKHKDILKKYPFVREYIFNTSFCYLRTELGERRGCRKDYLEDFIDTLYKQPEVWNEIKYLNPHFGWYDKNKYNLDLKKSRFVDGSQLEIKKKLRGNIKLSEQRASSDKKKALFSFLAVLRSIIQFFGFAKNV